MEDNFMIEMALTNATKLVEKARDLLYDFRILTDEMDLLFTKIVKILNER